MLWRALRSPESIPCDVKLFFYVHVSMPISAGLICSSMFHPSIELLMGFHSFHDMSLQAFHPLKIQTLSENVLHPLNRTPSISSDISWSYTSSWMIYHHGVYDVYVSFIHHVSFYNSTQLWNITIFLKETRQKWTIFNYYISLPEGISSNHPIIHHCEAIVI